MNFSLSLSGILEAIRDSNTYLDRADFFFVSSESTDKPNARAMKISGEKVINYIDSQ